MASSMGSYIRRASLEARRRVRCKAGPVSTGPLSFDRRMKTKDDALFSSAFFLFPSPFLLSHGWYVTWRCCLISTCTISAGHDEWGLCRRLIPFFFPSVHRRSSFFFCLLLYCRVRPTHKNCITHTTSLLDHWSADAFLFNTFPTSRHRSTIPCSSDGRRCVRAVTKASLHSVLKRVATPRQTRLLGSHPTALVPHTPIQIREQATHNKRTRTDLDRLVCPTRNQPRPRHVKRRAKHARLGFERPRLRDVVHVLKRRARVVIPQCERPIVAYTGASAFPPTHTCRTTYPQRKRRPRH